MLSWVFRIGGQQISQNRVDQIQKTVFLTLSLRCQNCYNPWMRRLCSAKFKRTNLAGIKHWARSFFLSFFHLLFDFLGFKMPKYANNAAMGRMVVKFHTARAGTSVKLVCKMHMLCQEVQWDTLQIQINSNALPLDLHLKARQAQLRSLGTSFLPRGYICVESSRTQRH